MVGTGSNLNIYFKQKWQLSILKDEMQRIYFVIETLHLFFLYIINKKNIN